MGKKYKKRVEREVICQGCGISFFTKREEQKYHTFECYRTNVMKKDNPAKFKKGKPCWFKGMTYEEAFGEEKAKSRKRRGSEVMKDNHNRGRIPPIWNKGLTKETNESLLKASKKNSKYSLELWQDPEYVSKQMKSRGVAPNKQEKKLNQILQELFPDEWKFVGDGEFILGGKCPDFVNINGQKKIIDLFGNYWHSERIQRIPEDQHEQERINLFSQYGYKTLIIWERELENLPVLQGKIRNFCNELL